MLKWNALKEIIFFKLKVTLVGFKKLDALIEKWKFHSFIQPSYGCSGKRTGKVSWRKQIKNPLGSIGKVSCQNYFLSVTTESPPAEKQ